jgi:AraC family transcriptional regulator
MIEDCYAGFSKSIDFIEANLQEPITVMDVADQVGHYSISHFVRLFHFLTGYTPGNYLQKRRLSEAAFEIVTSNQTFLNIAISYQFGSHEAFTRAIKKQFGITPVRIRQQQPFLHLTTRAVILPPRPEKRIHKDPLISDQPKLILAGFAYHGDNTNFELPALWRSLMQQKHLIPSQRSPQQTYGLWCYPDNFQTHRKFDYLAGVEMEAIAGVPASFSVKELKPFQYAHFEHIGMLKNIRQTYIYIYGEWLPQSGYQLTGNYDLEYYDEQFTGAEREDSVLNILVPIKNK